LNNVDLTADTGLSHVTIDKSPRLHAMVMQKIADTTRTFKKSGEQTKIKKRKQS
jgi:hypothetical protein